jgi:ATP-dependent helicase HrpB
VLPVYQVREALIEALSERHRVVLTAPTGSGKSTQVPRMLLDCTGGRIIVLQPRRLAARILARRVAEELGVPLGGLVGYQTRHEREVGPDTRILFLTEGLFLRMAMTDPTLADTGVVILDEFHERHLDTDASLALVLRAQETVRPDLGLVVMSATLDAEAVSAFLDCPALRTDQRVWPVEITHLAPPADDRTPIWVRAARAIARVLRQEPEGDLLVFMPGLGEIERTLQACRDAGVPAGVDLLPLYGELPPAAQDRAVTPGPRRKVIVATNVAETSITIEGIRHVIDSGLVRRQHFDPRRGFNVLSLGKISHSSADQRAGRAGRTAPGSCLRLWSLHDHRGRPAQDEPEIRRLDLSGILLLLKAMGLRRAGELAWFDIPPTEAVEAAELLLQRLGAADATGTLTPVGRTMARLPMHPRLARMVTEGGRSGSLEQAALWAALLSERNLFLRSGEERFDTRRDEEPDDDFARLEAALAEAERVRFDPDACGRLGIHGHAARQVIRTRDLYRRAWKRTGEEQGNSPPKGPGACLLAAFPDQVAHRRGPGSPVFELSGGRTAHLAPGTAGNPDLVVAAEVTEVGSVGGMQSRLSLVLPLSVADLEEAFPDRLETRRETVWDPERKAVRWVERLLYDELALRTREVTPEYRGEAAAILARRILSGELVLRRWGAKEEEWIARVRCVAEWFPERQLITYSEDDLLLVYQEICEGATRYSEVKDRPCLDRLRNVLSWDDQRFVTEMAPERIQLPRGYRMRITYTPGERPRGRAKIQDFYGLDETPTVAGGRQKLLLDILAPSFRPVQTTDDLAGFWTRHYPDLKKALQRRYPKHLWK